MATIQAANALARLRTRLDEATAAFWSDAECYAALSDGQRTLINMSLAVWRAKRKANPATELPVVLQQASKVIAGSVVAGQSAAAVPADYLDYVNIKYSPSGSTQYPCLIVPNSTAYPNITGNQYLYGSTTSEYMVAIFNGAMNFSAPATGTGGSYGLNYIAAPLDLSASINGVLVDTAQEAVVTFAFGILLQKDGRVEEAVAIFREFMTEAQTLVTE